MKAEIFIDGEWVSTAEFECVPQAGDRIIVQDKRMLHQMYATEPKNVSAYVELRTFRQSQPQLVGLECSSCDSSGYRIKTDENAGKAKDKGR